VQYSISFLFFSLPDIITKRGVRHIIVHPSFR
jgi:hypothetical protein